MIEDGSDRGTELAHGTSVQTLTSRPSVESRRDDAPRDPRNLLGRLSHSVRWDVAAWLVVGAVVALLLWSRLAFLDSSLWHDESYTAVHFIDRGPKEMFFGYYNPNNHMLYSLLSWASIRLFGHSEAVYRMWSVIPGLLAVGVLALWAWRRLGPLVAATIVVLATVSPMHLELAPEARGYGLGFLAGAGMLAYGVAASDKARLSDIALFAAFGLLGIVTLPTLVLPFIGHSLVLCLRRDVRRRTLIACALVGFVSFVFYLPVLDQLAANTHREVLDPLSWRGALTAPYNDLARPTLAALLPNELWTISFVVATCVVVLIALGVRRLVRQRDWDVLLHILVPVLLTFVGFVVIQVWYAPRYVSFLLSNVIVLFAIGVAEVWTIVSPSRVLRGIAVVAMAMAIVVGSFHVIDETKNLPHENFQLVAQIIEGSGIRTVISNTSRSVGLEFYVGASRLRVLHNQDLKHALCDGAAPIAFVDHYKYGEIGADPNNLLTAISKYFNGVAVACLEQRGASRIHVRNNTRQPVDVWLLPRG